MINTDEHINDCKVQELINEMTNEPEKFNHLRVFLRREKDIGFNNNYEYLIVTPNAFGKVLIRNLYVNGSVVTIEYMDYVTTAVDSVQIDINGKEQNVLFICWSDVQDLVFNDMIASFYHV